MIVREMTPDDIEKLRKIHDEYYSNDFDFPNFTYHFLNTFVVTDDRDNIISASGIRPILEIITITDKKHSSRLRYKALMQTLNVAQFITSRERFNNLHAFIQDKTWREHLIRKGFGPTKGDAIIIGVSNG